MTVPEAVTAPAPITEIAWTVHRWPMIAPGPMIDLSTEALEATRAPLRSTEATTDAPSSTTAPAPTTDSSTTALAATDAPRPNSDRATDWLRTSTSPMRHTPAPGAETDLSIGPASEQEVPM